jgi:hypothetical protein
MKNILNLQPEYNTAYKLKGKRYMLNQIIKDYGLKMDSICRNCGERFGTHVIWECPTKKTKFEDSYYKLTKEELSNDNSLKKHMVLKLLEGKNEYEKTNK